MSKSKKEEKVLNNNNTIFDDVFRTMVQKMPELLIPLINEVFGTDYSEDEKYEQLRNEHMEAYGKVVTDSIIVIRGITYHIECQSVDDTTMAIRMMEYDFSIALENSVKDGRIYEIDFPESCVVYLRCTENTPNVLTVKVNFPNGKSMDYETRVIKVSNYTKDDIFKKKLLFFLPFYIMRYEREMKNIEKNSEKLEKLLKEYEDIRLYLERTLYDEEKSNLYTDLIKLIIKISDYMAKGNEKTKKGVEDVMGGQILELESERLKRLGKEEGRILTILDALKSLSEDIVRQALHASDDEIAKAKALMQKTN